MKTALIFLLLAFGLLQTTAWNDGLWGRELRKSLKPKFDAKTMKIAEEMINQHHYLGKGRKMAQLQKDDNYREVEE